MIRISIVMVCWLSLHLNAKAQWQAIMNGPCGGNVKSLLVDGNTLMAATSSYYNGESGNWGGLYLSTNNGSSWTKLTTPPNGDVNVLLLKDSAIFAGTDSGIYVTRNHGATWSSADVGLPAYSSINTLISNGSDLFTITFHGVYYSSNNGAQ